MSRTLLELEREVRGLGGLLGAATAAPEPGASAPLGATVARGSRARGREAEYALLVEAIHEGSLQHYERGRVVRPADADLALLAGDRLYALGLARLAGLGDLAAVSELADVISLTAQAYAEGRPEAAARAWSAGAAAVGAGPTDGHEAEKAAWRGGAGPE